jgi:hypothetical protein
MLYACICATYFSRISHLVSVPSPGQDLCYKIYFMTRTKYFGLILSIVCILFSGPVHAGTRPVQHSSETTASSQADKQAGQDAAAKQGTAAADGHAKAPHGKTQVPHAEELPHIHKFHKERVKKLKKHHGKCWFLSQALLFLCHAAILYISYLHLTH